MTISEIISFLNSKGFGKRERSYRLSFFSNLFVMFAFFFVICVCYL